MPEYLHRTLPQAHAVIPGTYPPDNGFETGRIRVLWNGSDTWVEWSQRNHTASDAATRP